MIYISSYTCIERYIRKVYYKTTLNKKLNKKKKTTFNFYVCCELCPA